RTQEVSMFGLREELSRVDKPIGIGIVGIGSIGRGMVLQSTITPGISCLAIADIILERATAWAEELELPYRVASSLDDMHDIIRSGLLAITDDGSLLAQCEDLDVFVEATNATLVGAQNGIL